MNMSHMSHGSHGSDHLQESYSDQQMKYPNHQRRRRGRWLPFIIGGVVLFAFFLMFVSIREERARVYAVQRAVAAQSIAPTRAITVRQTFQGRLAAARQISNIQSRNDAMLIVARDAASRGEANTVQQCVQSITDMKLREKAAVTGAYALADSGRVNEAVNLLQLTPNLLAKNAEPLLKKVCEKGDARAAQVILNHISKDRNATAKRAVLIMTRHHHTSAAVEIARRITDQNMRDSAMMAIAKNDTSELGDELDGHGEHGHVHEAHEGHEVHEHAEDHGDHGDHGHSHAKEGQNETGDSDHAHGEEMDAHEH